MLVLSVFFVGCNDEDQPQFVLGDWYAEYAAPGVTEDGIAYDRVVQAYHFDNNGTGYWYNIFLADGREEPVSMKGGQNIGSFTYNASKNNINVQLKWTQEMNESSWSLTPADGHLTGTNGGTPYTLTPATPEQMEWCSYWDKICNGGNDIDAFLLTMDKYTLQSGAGQAIVNNAGKWSLGNRLIMGNGDKSATISNVPVFAVGERAYLLNSYVSPFAKGAPLWAVSGLGLVSHNSASSGTFRFPSTYNCLMSDAGRQGIDIPLLGYTSAKGNSLHFRHVGAGIGVNITNSTNYDLVVDEVIVKSENYRLSSEALTLKYDEDDMHYIPETTSDEAEREVRVKFPSKGAGVFKIPVGEPTMGIVVPVLPIGNENLTIELRSHIECEGLTNAELKYEYSHKSAFAALARGQLATVEVNMVAGGEGISTTGFFSVSDSKAVYFSKGNLKATTTDYNSVNEWWTWGNWAFSFMDKQYDMVETGERSEHPDHNYYDRNIISLFGYGTSGFPNGQECYQPNSADQRGWMNAANVYFNGHLSGSADWGYNAITNGGNKQNSGWRTLNAEEWIYLLSSRPGCEEKQSLATVCGVKGAILLPDTWTLPQGLTWVPGADHYSTNTYSESDWAAMEAAGAVFLPAAGVRRINNVNPTTGGLIVMVEKYQQEGWYWSSSLSAISKYSITMYFAENDDLISMAMEGREAGCNVRLVRDVK